MLEGHAEPKVRLYHVTSKGLFERKSFIKIKITCSEMEKQTFQAKEVY